MGLADIVKINVHFAGSSHSDAIGRAVDSVDRAMQMVFDKGLHDIAAKTGTSIEDLRTAAQEIRNSMPDTPDREKNVLAVLQQMGCGQPKLGQVEVRDLAAQMAKLAPQWRRYSTNRWPREKLENVCQCGCADLEKGERWSKYSPARPPKIEDVVRWTWQGTRYVGRVSGCSLTKDYKGTRRTIELVQTTPSVYQAPRWLFGDDPEAHGNLIDTLDYLEYLEDKTMANETIDNGWRKYSATRTPRPGDIVRCVMDAGNLCEGVIGEVAPNGNTWWRGHTTTPRVTAWTVTSDFYHRLEFREAAAAACNACGAAPCDCGKPVWNYRWRSNAGTHEQWGMSVDVSRSAAAISLAKHTNDGWGERGPVQRVTDPHHVFPPGIVDPPYVIMGEIPAAIQPHKCALGWCASMTKAASFCSTNCEHTAAKIDAAYKPLNALVNRLDKCGPRGCDEPSLAGEVKWAKQKVSDEVAAIKSAWYALRHQGTEGNEGVWPVCNDSED